MKAISLWQPWASAVANGVKKIETRHWRTYYSGPLAIHAAQKRTRDLAALFDGMLLDQSAIFQAFSTAGEDHWDELPFGAIVATANLLECVRVDMLNTISPVERALGNYSAGRYGWILTDVKKLDQPIYTTGHQGIFNVKL